MKSFLIILAILILIALYYAYPLYKAAQITKEIESHTVPYEQNDIRAPMNILVAGDSTAYGVGAEKSQDSTAGLVGRRYPQASIENISKSGLRLEGLIAKIEGIDREYDLAIIQIGANDVIHFTSLEKVDQELETVLNIVTSHSKKVILLTAGNIGLAPVFKAPLSNLVTHRTKQVRDIFMRKAAAYPTVSYIDLYKERGDDVFVKDIQKYYAADRFHPSAAGYMVWYREIEKLLK